MDEQACTKDTSGSFCHRNGFTLVELLVVIAIIGVLVALLLPSIQAAREAGRRAQCLNHVKQLSLGLLNYESTNNAFPPGSERNWESPTPWNTNQVSWIGRILPFLEQQALYDRIDFTLEPGDTGVNVEVQRTWLQAVLCPSDEKLNGWSGYRGEHTEVAANTNYVVCVGSNDEVTKEYDANRHRRGYNGIFGYNSDTRIAEITDGLSNTMAVSECMVNNPRVHYYGGSGNYFGCLAGTAKDIAGSENVEPRGFSWFFAQVMQSWAFNTILAPNDSLTTNHECQRWSDQAALAARSHHPGGVNVGFADGSTTFIQEGIDILVWRGLSTKDWEEVTGER
jgi:prepilin-type N-terminal cleavage/methylation domain-containing protein/prepilin-type processing-associated H-X9-DG protein